MDNQEPPPQTPIAVLCPTCGVTCLTNVEGVRDGRCHTCHGSFILPDDYWTKVAELGRPSSSPSVPRPTFTRVK